MGKDKDYFLGTHDDEIARLALQHRVWRPRASDAWKRAGFNVGQTLLDVGCGPGFATVDMAEIVGPSGKIVSLDRSRRFLDYLESIRLQRGLENIVTNELDLDEGTLPSVMADGAWARWVFAFVKHPRELLERVSTRLKKGGVIVLHEYFDYSTWRLAPRCLELEEFVSVVTKSWRESGGEPEIGLNLPSWLEETGFEIQSVTPIIDIVPSSNYIWQWLKLFIDVEVPRFVHLGYFTPERAEAIASAFAKGEASPHTRLITPAVIEIIAVKR